MIPRDVLKTVFVLSTVCATGRAFLLPLLFPVSIRITINRKHHPPPPKPDYHFSTVPVYKEVVVKGSVEPGFKHSYGDGHKYGTSYGDGHVKVYTDEPHIKGHKYAKGYGTGSSVHFPGPSSGHNKGGGYITFEGSYHKGTPHQHYPDTEYVHPEGHHKGTEYIQPIGHHKGTEYIQPIGHHKGTEYIQPIGHDKGTEYVQPIGHDKGTEYIQPIGHNKGTDYVIQDGHHKGTEYIQPIGHDKGTEYIQPIGHNKGTDYVIQDGHHKGTEYIQPNGHHKGAEYIQPGQHHKGTQYLQGRPYIKNHSYIKSVGGYKMSDYLPVAGQQGYDEKPNKYISHVAIPPKVEPGNTYAEISSAHKAVHAPKAYDAHQYADLGQQYRPVQDDYADESGYLDDSMPAYKYPPTILYQKRSGQAVPHKDEPTLYAGFGTSVYGDSYAKVVYRPKNLRISIRAHRH